jgi:hypothetical protein
VVVGGGLTAGVTAALGSDIYQELLKKPFRNLVRRLRGCQLRAEQRIALLTEVWFTDAEVLVQVVVQFRVDEPPVNVSEVLTQATESASEYVRSRLATISEDGSGAAIRIVRVEVKSDGTMGIPLLVDPALRLPGTRSRAPRERRNPGASEEPDPGA